MFARDPADFHLGLLQVHPCGSHSQTPTLDRRPNAFLTQGKKDALAGVARGAARQGLRMGKPMRLGSKVLKSFLSLPFDPVLVCRFPAG